MRYDRRATGRKAGKPQTLEILGGGHGFVLVDLDTPIPRPDPIWLAGQLAERGVQCEFPGCGQQAVNYIELPDVWTPFVCKSHEVAVTNHNARLRSQMRKLVMDAMLDEILLTSFDKPRRWENSPDIMGEIERPLRPDAGKPAVVAPTVTFRRPKLGQN